MCMGWAPEGRASDAGRGTHACSGEAVVCLQQAGRAPAQRPRAASPILDCPVPVQRGLLPGCGHATDLISRDEGINVEAAGVMYR